MLAQSLRLRPFRSANPGVPPNSIMNRRSMVFVRRRGFVRKSLIICIFWRMPHTVCKRGFFAHKFETEKQRGFGGRGRKSFRKTDFADNFQPLFLPLFYLGVGSYAYTYIWSKIYRLSQTLFIYLYIFIYTRKKLPHVFIYTQLNRVTAEVCGPPRRCTLRVLEEIGNCERLRTRFYCHLIRSRVRPMAWWRRR